MRFRWMQGPRMDKDGQEGGEPEWAKKLGERLEKLEAAASKPPASETTPKPGETQQVPAPAKPNPENPPEKPEESQSSSQEKPKRSVWDWLL